MDKEQIKATMQQFLTLEPVLTTGIGPKLKPYAKAIYFVLMFVLALAVLGALVSLFKNGFTVFLLELVLIMVNFVIIRMFCEYLNKD